ncbi:prepilin peptidase [Endozoicomonas sp. GU-1]|uniref:preprotein translocase subunit SecA n=1 Tax=Endozoicomonas sp. GU-1 TaxID=3009078 RepID=UPI0022B551D4|nr:prepilin peptidase [Endozoicomonas sp. GU-1]WBA80122.1 prepilin peptidase [Endozoicomonas sp. GU-1]
MFKLPQRRPASTLDRPQKSIPGQQMSARIWRWIMSMVLRPVQAQVWMYNPLLWKIKSYQSGLSALSDSELNNEIHILKSALQKKGLTHTSVTKAFAVIREVSGRELGMYHFDSQLLGGLAIIYGNIGQMQTGEGKTLTATLPVAASALAGIPSYLVTVNDYLTQRDAELMMPVYQRLGLSVGVIIQGLQTSERQSQYACDIVYCTNNELAFDYLKDSIILKGKNSSLNLHAQKLLNPSSKHKTTDIDGLMLRGLHFAVVDEADSVLLDEARTPLIISGEEAPIAAQQEVYAQAMTIVTELCEGKDYNIWKDRRHIELTPSGEEQIAHLTKNLGALWKGRVRRLELIRQALTAWHLFERDKQYLIDDSMEQRKVVIIDEHTGRMMPDRTWEQGLHQLIEIKENCPLSAPRETLASISFQNFFRHFHHLSGMTGTTSHVRSELWRVYNLPVVNIPTHKTSRRQFLHYRIFQKEQQKWQAVLSRVRTLRAKNRPVLIGTLSLADSEQLSQYMDEADIDHQVLNARQDKFEADIVAKAGAPGTITIATSMAGRGTDIKIDDATNDNGGLHVIITGLHESSRIDRQLIGRCARQGDRGSYELLLSLEDSLLSSKWSGILQQLFNLPLPIFLKNWCALMTFRYCQSQFEHKHERARKHLLRSDEHQRELLSFANSRV